jgi:hypothetical protein
VHGRKTLHHSQEDGMTKDSKHLMDEADIGSGEKNVGQRDVERDVRSVPERKSQPQDGRQLQEVVEEQQFSEMPSQRDGRNYRNEARFTEEADGSRVLRLGTHIARFASVRLPNGSYEAQVYVRLTREPQTAETYIPAGTFTSEGEAWLAAEERARRALDEREF